MATPSKPLVGVLTQVISLSITTIGCLASVVDRANGGVCLDSIDECEASD